MSKGMEKKCAVGFKGIYCVILAWKDVTFECEWCCGTTRVEIKDDLLINRTVDSYVRWSRSWRMARETLVCTHNSVFSQYEVH